jgi:hypothetical protein
MTFRDSGTTRPFVSAVIPALAEPVAPRVTGPIVAWDTGQASGTQEIQRQARGDWPSQWHPEEPGRSLHGWHWLGQCPPFVGSEDSIRRHRPGRWDSAIRA